MGRGQVDPSAFFPESSSDSKLLKMAFALVNRGIPSDVLKPEQGSLRAYYKKRAANGTLVYEVLPFHNCTASELENDFYAQTYSDNAKTMKKFGDQLQCFDSELL